MAKKVVLMGLLGFPIGIAIGYFFTIVTSLMIGQGAYYPVVPELVEEVGSQIGAVIVQAVLCGLLGSGFAAASYIWKIESWSVAKQTAIYFLTCSVVMLPIAYITHWMERTFLGFALYFGVFVAIFALVWTIQFVYWKLKIAKLNQSLDS